ncbi:uncharacterized protein JN550_003725 [Neoarthrinium moseri]|uniref:uncharacterized protein n=1 Tax=Neoarthrinium moseri TaxID=1658444 RepID=UPI001FDBB3EF|nr:uncharacterized protein JN550_003725 [Neoarthrinium moseri]KAI1872851.1 hypothetical protein JN550_003725 [Neoarthrinium moseri]
MSKILLVSLLSGLALAGAYDSLGTLGSSIPDDLDASAREIIRDAQQNPNATRAVAFRPFNSAARAGNTQSLADVEWTWRVNISEYAMPDNEKKGAAVDSRIISTAYDFSWAGAGDMSSQLDLSEGGLCFTIMDAPKDFPVNVTNSYTKDDVNSASCNPVLGQACVDAIVSQANRETGSPVRCSAPQRSWYALPECQSTLGYTDTVLGTWGAVTFSYGFFNHSSNSTNSWENGEGWYGSFSAPQNRSGGAEYYTATNRLQIILVNPIVRGPGSSGTLENAPYIQGPQLSCMRVNTTKLPTGDLDGNGVVLTSEAVMQSVGVSLMHTAVSSRSLGLFVVLSIMFTIEVAGHLP